MTEKDILLIPISPSSLALAQEHAAAAEIGGKSQLRGDDRTAKLKQDQLVGQLGQIALSVHVSGNTAMYRLSRWFVNLDPTRGDGGTDYPGSNLDVKTTLIPDSDVMLSYHLLVRPKERHETNVYILALAFKDEKGWVVALVGWIKDSALPAEPSTDSRFSGAYAVRADQLNPLLPIEWYY